MIEVDAITFVAVGSALLVGGVFIWILIEECQSAQKRKRRRDFKK